VAFAEGYFSGCDMSGDCDCNMLLDRDWPAVGWPPVGKKCVNTRRIRSVVCVTTGPYPIPKRVLHIGRSSTSFFNFHYPDFPLTLSLSN
jgi:hypothetical protein